ncbi:peptidoglycan-binding protein [Acidovorax sp. NPDC077693]|uniref:peptidoglycan-binding domain-containing protein n=1 Tax=unclassified Acidovorax TaxID=2684926 RepID=UPI0037C6A9F1
MNNLDISAPVGALAANKPNDVKIIQKLLKNHLGEVPGAPSVSVDGVFSSKLVDEIKAFQNAGSIPYVTHGRIEPRSLTLRNLNMRPEIFGYHRKAQAKEAMLSDVQDQAIEVLIFDAMILSPGSQWGHAAIDVDELIYTRAHSRYAITERDKYLQSNSFIRDFVGLVLKVSSREKRATKKDLERRVAEQKSYDIISNSCSTNVAEVLESIGILAHDPRFQHNPTSSNAVTPKELLIVVSRSNRLVKRVNYNKIKSQ